MSKERKITESNGAADNKVREFEADRRGHRHAAQPIDSFLPRTELGRRLWQIRMRILSSGRPLLDWDDIADDLRERRGEATEDPGN
jgi:hypothetical protein